MVASYRLDAIHHVRLAMPAGGEGFRPYEGRRRFHTEDPFGSRVELIEWEPSA